MIDCFLTIKISLNKTNPARSRFKLLIMGAESLQIKSSTELQQPKHYNSFELGNILSRKLESKIKS